MKKITLSLLALALAVSLSIIPAIAADHEPTADSRIVKVEGSSTLYYISTAGNRYVFPNEKTYKSWFVDFSDVEIITADQLAQYPLIGNIRYRPGVLLIKIDVSPKVYAVSRGGVLRWIKSENLARRLYGADWNQLIDDIPIFLFGNYRLGHDIDQDGDFDPDEEVNQNDSIERERGLALGHLKRAHRAHTVKCRAIPAIPAIPGGPGQRATPAIPAISARVCKLNQQKPDETAPIISDVIVTPSSTATTTAALVTWKTDEEATSEIEYADESLATASTTITISDATLVMDHSLELTDLTASTTHYFILKSADASSNIATTTEDTFTTPAE